MECKVRENKRYQESIRLVNAHLDSLVSKIYNCQNDLIRDGAKVTATAIKDKLSGKQEKGRMLITIFKQHNKEVEKLVGKDYAPGTLDRYKVILNHLQQFMQKKYGIDDIDIKMLNHEFITDFNFFLRTVRNCGNKSAVKCIKILCYTTVIKRFCSQFLS